MPHKTPWFRCVRCIVVVAGTLCLATSPGCYSRQPSSDSAEVAEVASSDSASPPDAGSITVEQAASGSTATTADRDTTIARAESLAEQQQWTAAAKTLQSLLVQDPDDVEVLFRLANIAAAGGDLARGVELLEAIPADHPEAGIAALGQSADWCFELQRYQQAEAHYRAVLQQVPEAYLARRQLAYLLNRQGRRHEAAEQIRQLCREGNVRQDELHALVVLGDAMYDPPGSSVAPGQRPYWPIGVSGEARQLFTEARYEEAAKRLHPLIESGQATPDVMAFYGRVAAEAQDDSQFLWWLARTDETTQQYAEYWAGVGTYLLAQRRFDEAARALAEAVDRDPTDFLSIGRLRQALLVLGDDQLAERWNERWDQLRAVLRLNNQIASASTPDLAAIDELAAWLVQLHRPLEAVLWKSIEAHHSNQPAGVMQQLNQQRQQLVAAEMAFPSADQRLCQMEVQRFPLPDVSQLTSSAKLAAGQNALARPATAAGSPTAAAFENVAEAMGLDHSYRVATEPLEAGFSIYQVLGGGVASLDFDLDGKVEFYLAQGAADPPRFVAQETDQLVRNLGDRLLNVTERAGMVESQYTTAVTAGDWNQDGFADLVVANLGDDVLWINNGDGTFTGQTLITTSTITRVPSSMAVADLSGDGLPDIYQACYVDDPALTRKPATNAEGRVIQSLLPNDFIPGQDRLIKNDGQGHWSVQPWPDEASAQAAASTGLGVVVTDFDGQPGVEAFVGNDNRPNQLWQQDEGSGSWSDVAAVQGAAFSSTGRGTASMGIAAGDLDRNGLIDLHVTNFQDEAVSLFLNFGRSYLDRNTQYGLDGPSKAVLGFGTQAIDYDNDGDLDLAVTNGHIEQAVQITAPFRQPAQLFANLGGRFQSASVQDQSGYWQQPHLGRAMARLDFDRDGRQDLVITHLGEPSAVLINQTATPHHWLQLQLVGIDSERDAIGARVEVRSGDQTLSEWVIAGDGYFSRNEPVVHFGLADVSEIDELRVIWPSGRQQTFDGIAVDRRWLLIENQTEAFELR